jgi:hypothetical protein
MIKKRLLRECVLAADAAICSQHILSRKLEGYSFFLCEPALASSANIRLESGSSLIDLRAARSMQSLDEFPFPDDRCVVIGVIQLGVSTFVANVLIRDASSDPAALCLNGYAVGDRVSEFLKLEGNLIKSLLRPEHSLLDRKERWNQWLRETGRIVEREDNRSMHMALADGPEHWHIDFQGDDGLSGEIEAMMLLVSMSSIALPCGYALRVGLGQFGTKGFQHRFCEKPLISIIRTDRLYRMLPSSDTDEASDRACPIPHGRRGHIRYHWTRSGVPLLSVPKLPIDRLRLAQKKKVRRSYVHPCWVGESKFVYDGMDCEVVTGTTDWPPL